MRLSSLLVSHAAEIIAFTDGQTVAAQEQVCERGGGEEAQSHHLLGQVFNKQQSLSYLLQTTFQEEHFRQATLAVVQVG